MKEEILEVLKRERRLHLNELHRRVGCGKQTLINALKELEEDGVITVRKEGRYKIIEIKRVIPTRTLALILVTLAVVPFTLIKQLYLKTPTFEYNGCPVVIIWPIPIIALSFLLGFWISTIMFNYDKLEEDLQYLVQFLRRW
ncbi:MAG: helix-turn-helix domain-containing protein [Sulfurovum sp.]|nr:helix-turn-helix domain-containing protein [Sulfurovum sp.]